MNATRRVLLSAALAAALIGCDTFTQTPDVASDILATVTRDLERNPSARYHAADPITPGTTSGILLIAQGGPWRTLDRSQVGEPAPKGEYHRVLARQRQMTRGVVPANRFITAGEAKEINLYSAATLFALGEHFAAQGRKVVVMGSSFGAALVNETLRRYGHRPFTKIIIAVSRIDMQPQWARSRFNGILTGFKDGTTLTRIACAVQNEHLRPSSPEYHWTRTKFRLQADLAAHRYSESIPRASLGKIIYYFGAKDPRVGSLTDDEVYFLTGRRLNGSGAGYETKTVSGGSEPILRLVEAIGRDRHGDTCETRGIESVAATTIRIVHGLDGGRATVKYAPEEGHQIVSLNGERHNDILAAFAAAGK